jgi:glycosyltransferase involved in cell wall biosynthesis
VNITCYSHYFIPEIGAPSARIYDLCQQWLDMGHCVQVVTCFPNHPTGRLYPKYKSGLYLYEKLDGIDVHRHWTYITPNRGFLKKTFGHMSYLPSSLVLSNPRAGKADVAIGTSPTFFAAMAAAWTGYKQKIPFIMEIRDLWPSIFVELGILRNRRVIRWLERWELALYRQATRVVTVTEAFRKDLIKRGVPEKKIITIPNGADVEFWRPERAPSDLGRKLGVEDCFVVLYIGAHGISQALESVLASAGRLRDYPRIQFLFVGEGAEKEKLVRRARQNRLKNVHFLGSVEKKEVKKFYALADVCLVPLKNIPLFGAFIPSKMFEIMSMGRPIIGSVRGESAQILRRSGGALVVEPEDGAAIAQAILWACEHPQEAQSMGQRARQFVLEHYSRRSLAARYGRVINDAIAEYGRDS